MSAAEVALIVIAVLALVGALLWRVADRLDRLHRREFQSRATLETNLVRRAETAAELALSGALDPASSVLVADGARAALQADRLLGEERGGTSAQRLADRGLVESDLSRRLRVALGGPESEPVERPPHEDDPVCRVREAHYRVELARRFHNDAVVHVHRMRRLALVRWLRLAGRAPLPSTFEMDDAPV